MTKGREKQRRGGRTRRLSYGCLFVAGFLQVFFFGGAVTYGLFFLVTLLPLASWGQAMLARRRTAVTQSLSAAATGKGVPVEQTVRVQNKNRWLTLPGLRLRFSAAAAGEAAPFRLAAAVPPREKSEVSRPVSFPYRGRYEVPGPEVQTGDMLGLCWLSARSPAPATLIVCPRVHELRNCRLSIGQAAALPRPSEGSGDETTASSDSRKYQYGDPVNRVHWKLTARKNELITRLFEDEEEPELLVLLDVRPPAVPAAALETADRLVECALAVLFFCLRTGVRARLVHGATGAGAPFEAPLRDRATFDAIFDHLSAVAFSGGDTFESLCRQAAMGGGTGAGAVLFTAALTPELLAAAAALRAPGRPVSLVWAAPHEGRVPFEAPDWMTVCVVPPGGDVAGGLTIDD
ncbi:MAG: DUF58 domain-containing protein [Oscillospiraceae bacterium]|nr:DUF58 domain-containing protein [Oscillospiraceae bacterium]